MKGVYKMTVRFDLNNERERAIAEYMQKLDVKQHQSRNHFTIEALAEYINLHSIPRKHHEKDIRNIIREEMRSCFAEVNFVPQPLSGAPTLTAKQQEETEQNILDDLKMFD